jgi:hypothetical protein
MYSGKIAVPPGGGGIRKKKMLFGAKMVLCALAGLSASLRSAANLPAAAHKTSFLLLIT